MTFAGCRRKAAGTRRTHPGRLARGVQQTMPDRSTCVEFAPLPGVIAACAAMHLRLVQYGRIVLRGADGTSVPTDSFDIPERIEFTGVEGEAAWALHRCVIRLPEVRMRFLLQTFYRDGCAAQWPNLSVQRKVELLSARDGLTDDLNAKLRRHNRAVRDPVPIVNWRDFEGIRERSIRILCNNEAVAAAQHPNPTQQVRA